MVTIVILISLGVILIALDIIFVPGMILGIFGGLVLIAGVITAFSTHGLAAGTISLGIAFAAIIILVVYAFKADVWSRFALNHKNESRVNAENKLNLIPGQTGTAVSALRPSGKAEFEGNFAEVNTYGEYCPAGTPVKVTKIENGKVWVEKV